MIAIVRMKAQERPESLWDYVVTHTEELQDKLRERGRLLYISRRAKHEDVSLFVHVADSDVLGSVIADELGGIQDLTGCWVINMLKPVFFPLPKDTRKMERYVVTLRVFPSHLSEVYEDLLRVVVPQGIMMTYLALTCHLYGDSLQFSVLADDEDRLNRFIADRVKPMPGVLKTTISYVERTKPLVSYDEWMTYSTHHSLIPSWSERLMVDQFGS